MKYASRDSATGACHLLVLDDEGRLHSHRETTRANAGCYARWDDCGDNPAAARYPQVCIGGGSTGPTIEFPKEADLIPGAWARCTGATLVPHAELLRRAQAAAS